SASTPTARRPRAATPTRTPAYVLPAPRLSAMRVELPTLYALTYSRGAVMRSGARNRKAVIVQALLVVMLLSGIAVAQDAVVRITGPRSITMPAADLAAMPRTTLTVASRGQD